MTSPFHSHAFLPVAIELQDATFMRGTTLPGKSSGFFFRVARPSSAISHNPVSG